MPITVTETAKRLARKVFETRGSKVEVHLSEEQLTQLFKVAIDLAFQLRPTPDEVEETVR